MTKHVIESVEFQLNESVKSNEFIAAVDKTKPFVTKLNGFVRRYTCQKEDGLWLDVVEWCDMAAAKAAAEKFMQAEAIKEFISLIDPESIRMQHFEIEYQM